MSDGPGETAGRGRGTGLVGWLIAINLLALAMRLWFFTGYQGADDAIYLDYGRIFAQSGQVDATIQTQWIGRAGAWLPIALAFACGAPAWVAEAAFPLVCSLGVINLLTVWLTRRFDLRTGVLAGLLMSLLPVDVIFSTTCYPDGPLALFTLGCLATLLWTDTARQELWRYGVAGLLLGLGILIRETSVLTLVPVFFVSLPARIPDLVRRLALFGALLVVPFLGEMAFFQWQTGEPLFRFKAARAALQRVLPEWEKHRATVKNLSWLPVPPPHRRDFSNDFVAVAREFFGEEEIALFGYLAVLALPICLMSRERLPRDLAVTALSLTLLLLYTPLHQRYTLPRSPRYLLVMFPALVGCIAWAVRTRLSPRWQWGVVGLTALTSVAALALTHQTRSLPALRQVHEFRLAHPNERMWATPEQTGFLLYHANYAPDMSLGLLLEKETKTSNAFRETQHYSQDLPLAERLVDAVGGHAALPAEGKKIEIPDTWQEVARLEPQGPLVQLGKWLVSRAGLPRVLQDRLNPRRFHMIVYRLPEGTPGNGADRPAKAAQPEEAATGEKPATDEEPATPE